MVDNPKLKAYVRKLERFLFTKKTKVRIMLQRLDIEPFELIMVNPAQIKHVGIGWKDYNKVYNHGMVMEGDWDLNKMPFDELDIFKAFEDRFIKGKRWEETNHFRCITARLASRDNTLNVKDDSELTRRTKYWEELYNNIKANGYLQRDKILEMHSNIRILDEISVRIGRDGDLLFEDGRHRLAVCKILRIPNVPVLVTWRHKRWYDLRRLVIEYAKSNGSNILKFINHPDISQEFGEYFNERFDLISSRIPDKGTVLDLTASWGENCHPLEERGLFCYALEKRTLEFELLSKIKCVKRKKFAAIPRDFFSFHEKNEFDVILALNDFQKLFDEMTDHSIVKLFLKRLKTGVIFYEPRYKNRNESSKELNEARDSGMITFFKENIPLKSCKIIGYTNDHVPIYMMLPE